jgi:glycosyltransferase involved in cell wall biosynthesis
MLSGRYEHWASFPAFVNPRWCSLIYRTFVRERVDIILCRDLPLAPVAVVIGKMLGLPVVIDVAEHYPGLLRDLYNRHNFKFRNLLIRNPYLASVVERIALPAADRLLVVVEESARRLERIGVDPERITVVSNTPPAPDLVRVGPTSAGRNGEPMRLVYLGKIEYSRGLSIALQALQRMQSDGPPVTLDVFGTGRQLEFHRREADRLGLNGTVTFHGFRPHEEALGRLSSFDVGVIPHHATRHWNYTIQNKLFDYMGAGLPVLVSSMPPAARIVSATGAGLVFHDRNVHSFTEAVQHLSDPAVRERMGAAGRKAVAQTYSWEHDAQRLKAAIEDTAANALHDPSQPAV